jgi:hypothetical protein
MAYHFLVGIGGALWEVEGSCNIGCPDKQLWPVSIVERGVSATLVFSQSL